MIFLLNIKELQGRVSQSFHIKVMSTDLTNQKGYSQRIALSMNL